MTAAGIIDNAPYEEQSFAGWQKVLATNLDGTWLFAREVGRHMLSQKPKAQ
jgi:sorbose reductase